MSDIGDHVLEYLRAETDMVELVSARVPLEKRGSNHVGDCPFCAEPKTFNVSNAHKFFHCFKCKESGDAFSFVMRTEQVSLPEAVKFLTARACP